MKTRLKINITSREQMIALGVALGMAIQDAEAANETNAGRPRLILNNGDNSSGKSLFALACDAWLEPHHYPNGLTRHQTVNEYIAGEEGQSTSTVLRNFYYERMIGIGGFDQRMQEVLEYYRGFKVLFMQNLFQANSPGATEHCADVDSRLLDMNIRTRTLPSPEGGFAREVRLTFYNQDLLPYFLKAIDGMRKNPQPLPIAGTGYVAPSRPGASPPAMPKGRLDQFLA